MNMMQAALAKHDRKLRDEYEAKQEAAEQAANARLIAAAPDLLEALEFCAASFDPDTDALLQSRRAEMLKQIRAAIAKAKGE